MEVPEGQSCTFECVLSHENPSDVAIWTVGGKTVGGSGRFRATRQGRKYTLVVQDVAPGDAGEVVFSVRDLTSKASLIIRGGHHVQGWGPVSTGVRVEWGLGPETVLLGTVPQSPGSSPVGGPEAPAGVQGVSGHLRELTLWGESLQSVGRSRVGGLTAWWPLGLTAH